MSRRVPLLAALVAIACSAFSLSGEFLYDDHHVILDNRSIRDLRAWRTVLLSEPSRPLLNLTWALNYAVSGSEPWSYRVVNVSLHGANAALVAALFLWMTARSGRAHGPGSALAGAAFFAVSPMAAETVGYVASRSTALASCFGLGALVLGSRGLETRSRPRLAAALAALLLGLLTKEEAAAVPLLLLLLDLFVLARGRLREACSRLPLHLPFLLLPVAGLVARRAITGAWLPEPALPWSRWLATQCAVFPQYVLRALVPLDPAFYRGHPPAGWPPEPWVALGVLGSAALLAGAVAWRRRAPDWSLAVLWMAASLLPSSSILPLKEMVVDHRAYLGGVGVAWALCGLWRPPLTAFTVALLVALGLRSAAYQRVLADPVHAWEDAVRRAPLSAEAHRGLGEAYLRRGDGRAEPALRRAVTLDPADAAGWTNLGAFLLESGRADEAETAWRSAAEAAPGNARIRDNLGMLLLRLGRAAEAEAELEAARRGVPALAQPRITLAGLAARRGDRARAEALVAEAWGLEIDAEDARRLREVEALLR